MQSGVIGIDRRCAQFGRYGFPGGSCLLTVAAFLPSNGDFSRWLTLRFMPSVCPPFNGPAMPKTALFAGSIRRIHQRGEFTPPANFLAPAVPTPILPLPLMPGWWNW